MGGTDGAISETGYLVAAVLLVLGLTCLSGCLGEIRDSGEPRVPALDTQDLLFPEQVPAASVSEGAFKVSEYAPVDSAPWQNVEVWVLFSKAVIPMSKLEKPDRLDKYINIIWL